MRTKNAAPLFVAILVLVALPLGAAQSFRLTKVDATGLKRLTATELIRLSGLSLDRNVAVADLDAAASKLASTGFFTDVRYKYLTTSTAMTVTFEVVEAPWNVPVIYDNFVWFTDDELTKAVQSELSSFDGTVPDGGAAVDLITRALTQALRSRNLPGQVDYKPFSALDGTGRQHVFAVTNPGVRFCALRVTGASVVPEAELLRTAASETTADYSRFRLQRFARETMTQAYRRQGYWRAAFGPPVATQNGGTICQGASVTMAVDEGAPYTWDHAEWSGNMAIPSANLDAMLGFKAGDVADASKIDAGLRAIEYAHGKLGYLQERANFTPVLNDAARRATFRFGVAEGPQFHMGAFKVTGVPEKDQAALAKKWKLQPGDVYDASYLDTFRRDELRPFMTPPRTASQDLAVNPTTRVVDVTITIK